tara:strand:- start:7328 stop:7543 length:216 start_codon:yes stop_codon:yes gene_type:complete
LKTKRTKPTNKDFQRVIQRLGFDVMAIKSQVGTITEFLTDYLDFTGTKDAFDKFIKEKVESESADVEDTNP